MSTEAFTMIVVTQSIFTIVTAYYFFRVLKAPKHPEPDSYSDNDEE